MAWVISSVLAGAHRIRAGVCGGVCAIASSDEPVTLEVTACDPQHACASDVVQVRVWAEAPIPPPGQTFFGERVSGCGCAGADPSELGFAAFALLAFVRGRRRR